MSKAPPPSASGPADPATLPYRPGVGLVVFNRQGLVFAGQRNDESHGYWQFPQGGIDAGETPEQAALRELGEETGIKTATILAETPDWLDYDLPAALVGKVWKGRYRGQRQKWFALLFEGQDQDIDITLDHPEFRAWRWMALEAMLAEVVPFKRDLYAKIVAAFAPVALKLRR